MAKATIPPPELIDPNLEIESVDQLPIYLRTIKHFELQEEAAVNAEKKAVEKVTSKFLNRRMLDVFGVSVKIRDYLNTLRDRVCDYARNHEDELFTDKVRTHKTEAGSVSSRKQPEAVGFIDPNDDDETIAKRIIEQADLLPEFDRLRAEFANAFPFIRVRLSLDRASIVASYRDRTLLDEDLSSRGLKIVREPTKYSVKTT